MVWLWRVMVTLGSDSSVGDGSGQRRRHRRRAGGFGGGDSINKSTWE